MGSNLAALLQLPHLKFLLVLVQHQGSGILFLGHVSIEGIELTSSDVNCVRVFSGA